MPDGPDLLSESNHLSLAPRRGEASLSLADGHHPWQRSLWVLLGGTFWGRGGWHSSTQARPCRDGAFLEAWGPRCRIAPRVVGLQQVPPVDRGRERPEASMPQHLEACPRGACRRWWWWALLGQIVTPRMACCSSVPLARIFCLALSFWQTQVCSRSSPS